PECTPLRIKNLNRGAWSSDYSYFPGSSLGTSSARKEIADRSHRCRRFLHGEVADVGHHEHFRLRNNTCPDFRLTRRRQAVLLPPHNQGFVRNAAQPATEIRVTEPVRFEDVAERFVLALTRGAKLFR